MKISLFVRTQISISSILVTLVTAAFGSPVTPLSASLPSAVTPEPKTHTLFMGADVLIERDKKFYQVNDVEGGSFVINVKGQPIFVRMSGGTPVTLKIQQALKITETSVEVTNLKGERAYTAANDPKRKEVIAQVAAQNYAADMASIASDRLTQTQVASDRRDAAIRGGGPAGAAAAATAQPDVFKASQIAMNAQALVTNYAGSDFQIKQMGNELAEENFDEMAVEFEVSSAVVLRHPYVVLITNFHEREAPPGTVRNWVYAKSLDPIDNHRKKIHVEQGGFSPGFVLKSFQVHLYDLGHEVATTVAPKRVPLTRTEAFAYMLMDYYSSNKTTTAPALPAMARLPADLSKRLAAGTGTQAYYVRVSKDGYADEAFVDEGCSEKVADPYFEAVLKGILYKPALEKGKPVAGIAKVKLAELRL